MRLTIKHVLTVMGALCLTVMFCGATAMAAAKVTQQKRFDVKEFTSAMADFDPNNPIIPTGDTIKIAVVAAFSGPASGNGAYFFEGWQQIAHLINKMGGIQVDGKMKMVEIIKADHQSRPDMCKSVAERMVLQEKVQFLWGTDGAHYTKVLSEIAAKYNIIFVDGAAATDSLLNAQNFNRNTFLTLWSPSQIGRGWAYFFGQIRKKETKFYLLNQDYLLGREVAEAFKKGLQEYYPAAQIVGEDYHKLFLTDFAPYLTKVKASGAEVIVSADWSPDGANLLKQARQLGVKIPFMGMYLDDPNAAKEIGIEGTKGIFNINYFAYGSPVFKTEYDKQIYNVMHELWKKWKAPYNGIGYEHGCVYSNAIWWIMSVIERAKSTSPDAIIKVWEGDTYQYVTGKIVKMRACDHKMVQDLSVGEFVPPAEQKTYWNIPPHYAYQGSSHYGKQFSIPAAKIYPWMDPALDRCKGKSPSGD
jgi:branched-chain amino acid transport system substrate-binding protein